MRSISKAHVIVFAVVLALALLAAITVAWSRANVAGQNGFQSNGAMISGWYWLRSPGHTATWTFSTAPFKSSSKVYINFNPLVTNGVNGGSGYSTTAKLVVNGKTQSCPLTNPFRPMDPENSGGVGYQAYGHSSSPISPTLYKNASSLKVTVVYPFSSGCHVAVNKDCMTIGYSN